MTQEATEQPDYLFKICLIGDTRVGKTNYLSRLTRNLYNPDSKSTIGVEFATKSMEMKGKTVKAQIWDTAGQDRYRAITSAYYRGMIGGILFYDVTDLKSFTSLSKWMDEIDKMADKNVVILLVGNKCELSNREVSTERGKQFAKQHNFLFKEVSAAENINVSESFDKLIRHIVKKFMKNEDKQQRKEKKDKKEKNEKKEKIEKDDAIQSNSILLSASGLRNIVRNDVDYFTFKFGSCEMKMDKFFAQFLSPLVSRVLLSDPTVESLEFDYISKSNFPKFDQLFNEEMFGLLHKISRGESIDVNDAEAQKLMLFSILLYNNELFDILCKSHPIEFDINNVEAYIQQAMILDQMKKFFKDDEFDISEVFDDIAKNFESVDKKNLLNLPKNVIYTIISNKNLVIDNEDSLFDFIVDMFEGDDCNDDDENNLLLFLEKVEMKNLSEKKCFEYIHKIDPNKMNGIIWNNICRRFDNSKSSDDNNNSKKNETKKEISST